jgi:signal peptidase I
MNFSETFTYFYRSPKTFSTKQWTVIAIWSLLNIVLLFLYVSAGASIITALINSLYGIALIFLYFTRLLALAVSPIIWTVLQVLSIIRFVRKPDLGLVYEWSDALWFATLAATVIRSYFIEAYTIPTSSMEKSLLVGDFLFVSKVNYGSRLPMTPLAFPFTHNKMPFSDNTDSYLEWLKMPYCRMFSFQTIKNNDVVVFNYPARPGEPDDKRPVDKKENYIKIMISEGIERVTYPLISFRKGGAIIAPTLSLNSHTSMQQHQSVDDEFLKGQSTQLAE